MDWSNIYTTYKGQWVALGNDEQTVVGFGKTAKEALTRAKQNGMQQPILTRMPDRLIAFVGGQV